MTGHERIARMNIKGAINWIIGGYYNLIQDGQEEYMPESKEALIDEIYDGALNDRYFGGAVEYGNAPREMRFAGTEFCKDTMMSLLEDDMDFEEICEVMGW